MHLHLRDQLSLIVVLALASSTIAFSGQRYGSYGYGGYPIYGGYNQGFGYGGGYGGYGGFGGYNGFGGLGGGYGSFY